MNTHEAPEMLREARLRRTPGRIRLMEILLQAGRPLSHEEVEGLLPDGMMDRVSVYRALDAFVRAGIAHRVRLDDKRASFEAAHRCESIRCHPHFTCRNCGTSRCMEEADMPLIKGMPAGFRIERQEIYLEGVCSSCASKSES